ncbi:XrtA system polysaccharide deacetylase [Porticoccus sp. GXU_MW_L64]
MPNHAISIDVEDYYHVAAFKGVISPSQWQEWPSRVEQNTDKILQLLDNNGVLGTFFVLGWVAERHPQIVRRICAQGHEVASHGYSHQLIYEQRPDTFKEETYKSKQILEEQIQLPVHGYRAASYSITRNSLWAIDILLDLGFRWDSSIFPIYHDNYGIPNTPDCAYQIKGRSGESLLEIPLTTARFSKLALPAAGGGYFRLYPYWLSRMLFKYATRNKPGIFYIHPWEVDPSQPRIKNASRLAKFRHYNQLGACEGRLQQLLNDFDFDTISNLINELEQTTLEIKDIAAL